jgi:hypothetical protein
MPRLSRFLVLAAAFAASACASSAQPAPAAAPTPRVISVSEPPPREWEPWPPAQSAPAPRARVASGKTVTLEPRQGGWPVLELFEMVSQQTGRSILYDGSNATFKHAKIEFVGRHVVAEEDLFAWLQAVLSYRKLCLVPVGPKSSDGKQQWFVMDQADPALKSRPVFIDESEVESYADRDGLYVVTSLRVRDTLDAQRARNALTPISTQTAGIGRITDHGRFLVVGDFAPVVASMKRLLDRINAETTPALATPPTPAPPAQPRQ